MNGGERKVTRKDRRGGGVKQKKKRGLKKGAHWIFSITEEGVDEKRMKRARILGHITPHKKQVKTTQKSVGSAFKTNGGKKRAMLCGVQFYQVDSLVNPSHNGD